MSYQIGVWISSELYNADGWTPLDRAVEWIDGALNKTDKGGNATGYYDTVPAPVEDKETSFSTQYPCLNESCSYDHLLQWWDDYAPCHFNVQSDSNILITLDDDYHPMDGGRAWQSGKYAIAETGKYLSGLSSTYGEYGKGDPHDCMHTVLEEIGHNLLQENTDDEGKYNNGDGYNHHDNGSIQKHDGEGYITPMGIDDKELSFDSGSNNCDEYYSTSPVGYELHWSECAEGYFNDK